MNAANLVFLEKFSQANLIRSFFSGSDFLYLARTAKGVQKYKNLSAPPRGPLGLWIEDLPSLYKLQDLTRGMDVEYYFSYAGVKPSQIASQGFFQGPRRMELPDFRIRDFSLLNPSVQILQAAQIEKPKFSVIIPLFENFERAQKALHSWRAQKNSSYEIVLVDDGSNDKWIHSLIGQDPGQLTLVRLERSQKRTRGDHSFRAGLSRNIGFQKARGEYLVFCDSDIVVPSDFLQRIEFGFSFADVLMPMRWQLSQTSSQKSVGYEDVSFEQDVRLSPGAYWEQFQMQDGLWSERLDYWKWTSTFCLALSRAHFLAAGGFKKTFLTYGFEDTELGYKLHRLNLRFEMLPINTYHLFQPDTHSEYQNDVKRKERLLKISADRLFRHHPSPEVYHALRRWLE